MGKDIIWFVNQSLKTPSGSSKPYRLVPEYYESILEYYKFVLMIIQIILDIIWINFQHLTILLN